MFKNVSECECPFLSRGSYAQEYSIMNHKERLMSFRDRLDAIAPSFEPVGSIKSFILYTKRQPLSSTRQEQ